MEKQCAQCNTEFIAKRSDTKYCSTPCYKKYYHAKNHKKTKQQKKDYYQKRVKNGTWHSSYVKVDEKMYQCLSCGIDFNPIRSDARCCSRSCTDKLWRFKNKERIKQDQYQRYHGDVQRRISTNIRSRINKALKDVYKPASIIGSIGCTPEELKKHLENQFQKGMSWDNYGKNGWHIDHIKPLALYNLQNPEEFKKACHYSNLQPLWAKDNLKKGANYD